MCFIRRYSTIAAWATTDLFSTRNLSSNGLMSRSTRRNSIWKNRGYAIPMRWYWPRPVVWHCAIRLLTCVSSRSYPMKNKWYDSRGLRGDRDILPGSPFSKIRPLLETVFFRVTLLYGCLKLLCYMAREKFLYSRSCERDMVVSARGYIVFKLNIMIWWRFISRRTVAAGYGK